MNDKAGFAGRKVLVTGASGFIGSHLCRRLRKLGAEVHGVSRSARVSDECVHWWKAELDDEDAVQRLLASVMPDTIFHLASFVSGKRELEYVVPALRSNLLSTVNLLKSATEAGCKRIVLTGSLEEPEGNAVTATPASPYAAAKGAASAYARMFYALYATPVVTARLFMVYGPDQKDHNKLIPYVSLSLLRGKAPKLMSGTREVDWVFVDDVVDAYLVLATRPGIEGETIDVGSGELTPVRSVVEQIFRFAETDARPEFGGVADRPLERVRVADVARSFELTGWKPKTSLEEGLKKTVDWYRNNVTDAASAGGRPGGA